MTQSEVIERIAAQEASMMGRDIEVIQHLALEGGGWVLVYDCVSTALNHTQHQRRCCVANANGNVKWSGIMTINGQVSEG